MMAAGLRAAVGSRPVRAMAGRLSWGLADQAVSSMTNFVVGIFVARSLGATEFGIFTLAWVTYGVVLNVSRGLTTDPLVVRFSGVPETTWRAGVARSSGTALVVGLLAGGVCACAGWVLGGALGHAVLTLGVVLPALLLQDSWRFAFFASGLGHKAFVNDILWGIALVPALAVAASYGSVSGFVLAWGASAGVAAGYGCVQTGVLPNLGGVRGWLRNHRDLGFRYLVENVSNSGAAQLRMYGLGAIAGLSDVGAIRGAELMLGPFLAVLMGVSLVAVPEAARVLKRTPHRLVRFCLLLGGVQAAAALAWGVVLLLMPDSVGSFVLDAVWAPASALILPVTLSVTGAGLVAGAAAGLRALGAARRSLRAQLFASAGYLGFGLIGAVLAGAVGTSWGSTIAMWCGALLWWRQLRAAQREFDAQRRPAPPAERATPADHEEMRAS